MVIVRSQGPSPRIFLFFAAVSGLVLSGCMGEKEPAGSGQPEHPEEAFEIKVHHQNESGYAEVSIWNGAEGDTRTFPQNLAIRRPENLTEATFELEWTSATETYMDEARLAVGQSFMYLWKQTTGTGTLQLHVDDHEWGESYETIRVYVLPHDSDQDIAMQVDWEWNVEITMIEQIPLHGPEEEEEGRGTGNPR